MTEQQGIITSQEEKNKEPKIVLTISVNPDGKFELSSSLQPPMIIYIFEKLKINLLKTPEHPLTVPSPAIMELFNGKAKK